MRQTRGWGVLERLGCRVNPSRVTTPVRYRGVQGEEARRPIIEHMRGRGWTAEGCCYAVLGVTLCPSCCFQGHWQASVVALEESKVA